MFYGFFNLQSHSMYIFSTQEGICKVWQRPVQNCGHYRANRTNGIFELWWSQIEFLKGSRFFHDIYRVNSTFRAEIDKEITVSKTVRYLFIHDVPRRGCYFELICWKCRTLNKLDILKLYYINVWKTYSRTPFCMV